MLDADTVSVEIVKMGRESVTLRPKILKDGVVLVEMPTVTLTAKDVLNMTGEFQFNLSASDHGGGL